MLILLLRWMTVCLALGSGVVAADWPALHGNAQRDGYIDAELAPPFRLAWARHFPGERLGTAMEPIVADSRLYIATHRGNLYALDAVAGNPLWAFASRGPFLHSPAVADHLVVAASTDGAVYALDSRSGRLRWRYEVGSGGFAASPLLLEGAVFIGSRSGEFVALDLSSGRLRWRESVGAPIRQTAAAADQRVFVTAEDLRVRCFDAAAGRRLWTSAPLSGQSARDYYPVVVRAGNRVYLVVRTNPILNMAQRIARDRHLLASHAGLDDSDWKKVDAWTKSEAPRGDPELWAREQAMIIRHLETNRPAQSFFVLDAETGRESQTVPVLWAAGCQGVGAPPALRSDGRLLVFYRSVYGNWNHGVAPLVSLGLFDLPQNRIEPLFHQYGRQPAWNTFWGTADESQNFTVAGQIVFVVHQGTLSGFDLNANRLFPIWGERDTYGGWTCPPWTRNEWHGPGRGGVAIAGRRLHWLTGSRVLCLAAGESGPPAVDMPITNATTVAAPALKPVDRAALRRRLTIAVRELLSRRWAPLLVEPGLAGREFFYDDSGELFEALAWAYPHLPEPEQMDVRETLAREWTDFPPFSTRGWYPLGEGTRRENFIPPGEMLSRLGQDKPPHPFGNLSAIELYASRCGAWDRVRAAWPDLKASFDDFTRVGWKLDGQKGDRYANRYLGALLAFARLAERVGDPALAQGARARAETTTAELIRWWQRAADQAAPSTFKGSAELDPFIGGGNALSLRLAPHRHKFALFYDLSPDVADVVRGRTPEAGERVWRWFSTLYCTWMLVGEERQVHSGENFIDPPDLALGAFKAQRWLRETSAGELGRNVDLPFCPADLAYVTKLALALEAGRSP